MRLLTYSAILLIASASLLFAQDDPVQQVHAAQEAIGRAMRAKDTAALEKIWSPEMKVNSPGNKVMDRATVLALLREGHIQYSAYSNTVEATSTFKDLVIVMGHEDLTEAVGPDAGKPKTRRYTDVWQRAVTGSWMLIARQATYIAVP
ncbi:nuclear transport factor 2 family protein [Tunturibacter empetritectus]|uniref:Ketosteroid isomerase-like protein n=1 Tax=Tunturiibacter lichenicola TaxID=2051959 RepID=A0A7W8J5S1_9BACT|nr:nuclear transport factor 2 family protein [Edaphobacter lichenicola]MBB5343045.1 ketosteroid isomerase-like protein [Edaphobacter lichenicola]